MAHAAAPLVEREQALFGHAAHEVVLGRDALLAHRQRVRHRFPERVCRLQRRGVRGQVAAPGHGRRHEGALAGARAQIALGGQPLEDIECCLPGNTKLRGKLARRWEPLARCQTAVENAGAQLAINLTGQAVAAFDGQVDVHDGAGGE
ncbi:hypothetical protein D3C72_1109530 [compost metagenome]